MTTSFTESSLLSLFFNHFILQTIAFSHHLSLSIYCISRDPHSKKAIQKPRNQKSFYKNPFFFTWNNKMTMYILHIWVIYKLYTHDTMH